MLILGRMGNEVLMVLAGIAITNIGWLSILLALATPFDNPLYIITENIGKEKSK